jgi:hypothetical protein
VIIEISIVVVALLLGAEIGYIVGDLEFRKGWLGAAVGALLAVCVAAALVLLLPLGDGGLVGMPLLLPGPGGTIMILPQ